ncbi:MAG: hypothetical protein CVU05_04620 [Bacteroidetes bacterium HGW-Bacteroidetes-21]|nr:MAG: hypothetical protein CVU05_04620 [Bacteroidetes bacterium HGW-Bacteroidetes-21]
MNFIRKHGFSLLRWIIAVASFIYLTHILYHHTDEISRFFSETLPKSNFWLLVYVILLMPINWLLESLKWYAGIRSIEKVKLTSAIKSVLAGVTVAFVSPNRTGEFIGRITVLSPENRGKGIFASIHISLAQTLITIIAGVLSLTFLLMLLTPGMAFLYLVSAILLTTLIFWFYFRFYHISEYLTRKVFFRNIFNKNEVLVRLPVKTLSINLLLSALRYFVFVGQFILALNFADVELSITEMTIAIALVYLLMTVIPSFAMAELGIRGSVAVYVFGYFIVNPTAIVLATTLLWTINLVVPAIAGTFYLTKSRS